MNKMLKYCVFVLVVAIPFVGFSQNGDRDSRLRIIESLANTDEKAFLESAQILMQEAHEKNDVGLYAEVLMLYGDKYYRNAQYHLADSVFDLIQSLDQKQVSVRVANRSKLGKVRVSGDLDDKPAAVRKAYGLIAEFRREKDTLTWIDAYNSLASLYQELYKRDSALANYLKAIELAKLSNAHFQQAYLRNNIGLFYIDSRQYDKAREEFKHARAQARIAEARYLEGLVINNQGLLFMSDEKYEEARAKFREFLEFTSDQGADRSKGIAYLNLAIIDYHEDRLDSSYYYHNLGIEHFKRIEQKALLIRAMNGKARLLIKMGKYDDAKQIADSCRILAVNQKLLEDEMLANKLISNVYDSIGNKAEALNYFKEYKKLSDSLNDVLRDKVVAEMQTKYDVKEKEAVIAQQSAEALARDQADRIRQFRNTIIIMITAVLIISIAIYFYWRTQRNKRRMQENFTQELIKSVEGERGRIAQDLHDGLGQNLSVLKNQIGQLDSLSAESKKSLEKDLSAVIEQTRDISRSLYPSYLRKVGLTEAFSSLLERTEGATGIICTYDLPILSKQPSDEVKTHLFRILQECIANTLKHSEATALKVELSQVGERWRLIYQDNGKGMGSRKDLRGIGMMSISERTKMMGGSFNVSANELGKGFRLNVMFDLFND